MRHYFQVGILAGILVLSLNAHAQLSEKETAASDIMLRTLYTWHYNPPALDNEMSEAIFESYLEVLDPGKQYFLKEDIDALSHYENRIDNELQNQRQAFFELSVSLLRKRLSEIQGFLPQLRAQIPLDNGKESFLSDPDELEYAKNLDELKARWQKTLDHRSSLNYISSYKDRFDSEKDILDLPTPDEIEPVLFKQAEQKSKNSLQRRLQRKSEQSDQDYFVSFLSAVTSSYDPHTSYYPPEEKEDFDISMSGQLEGIGAVLREDDGYIKIIKIVPGSAASRKKEVEVDDVILKVGQGDEPPVDIVEMPIREAVKLIRGKKGTVVTLTIQKSDQSIRRVPIVRDIVIIEETFAKAATIKTASKRKLGYIYLPSFYRDFKNAFGRNANKDVRRHVRRLQEMNVDGLILDLRNNGGGSLQDAIDISGQFISKGPIVQVQNRAKMNETRFDYNPALEYEGPLLVLTNQYSASASEILAAALQDYGRAIIVGADHTFGKGTVQTFYNLDDFINKNFLSLRPLGSTKITIQKFFRINGESTQFKGVTPDIILPSTIDYQDHGEKDLPHALPWTETDSLSYQKWGDILPIDRLKKASDRRVQNSPIFKAVQRYSDLMEGSLESPQPISVLEIWEEQAKVAKLKKEIEDLTKEHSIHFELLDASDPKSDSEKDFLKQLKSDYILDEAVNILGDLING